MKKFLTLFTVLTILGSIMTVKAVDYYYRGNQNGWNATLMTTSTDGYYAYISALSYSNNGNSNNNFKISLTDDSWDYNCSIASPGFNGTDVTNMNSSSNSWSDGDWNNAIYHTSDYYVLVYFPNTAINSSSSPVMCASTTLPNTPHPTYTVVGTVPGLDWNASDTNFDMTENAGVYTFNMTDVELAALTYEYKFAQNHAYTVACPQEGNATFTITDAGIYDVEFTLDFSANPAYSVVPTFKQAAVVIPAVKMYGTFADGSTWGNTQEFTIAGNNESASLTIAIPQPGFYEFKMILGENVWRSNGYTYHRDFTSAADINGNEEANMILEADVAGNYTFKWIYENDSLNIAFQQCDYYLKNNWYGCAGWKWKGMTAGANGTYRLENVIYGGNGLNYNTVNDDTGANWKDQSVLYYMDGSKRKAVTAYDTVNFVLDPVHDTIWAEMVSKDVTVYTVASNSLALCDLGWQPTHPHYYTDMKKQEDGTYKWTKSDEEVVLLAGNVYFKVIKNRDYANGYWPTTEAGLECSIAQSGIYNIEVDFNPCTHVVTATPTLVKALNINNLIIQGSWAPQDMVLNGENDKALVTLSLEVGDYNFRLVDGGNNKYGNAQAFTRANNSYREVVAENGADMSINVDKAGEYLFTYIYETEQLVVSYPAIVPNVKIAPLNGKFTINAKGDTAVFSRGNLQYNYGENAWYAAEKQYEVLSDLNLRFGDDSYQGSIDMFGWSCESSNYGLLKSSNDAQFTGDFVEWGDNITDEKEWSTLSKAEWNYLLGRKKNGNGHELWTMIALGPDSLNGLALFPDDWTAPSGVTIAYGFYDLDDEETLKANSYSYAQWAQLEAAGAVFLPLAGVRAGYVGNVGSATNPLTGWYCWMDNVSDYGFYWLSTKPSNPNEADMLVAPWLNGAQTEYTPPVTTTRPRRYGHAVRLVTIIPKVEYVVIRDGLNNGKWGTLCPAQNVENVQGATFYQISYLEENGGMPYNMVFDQISGTTLTAGKPYFFIANATEIRGVKTGTVLTEADDAGVNGFYGYIGEEPKALTDWHAEYTPGSDNTYVIYGNMVTRLNGPTNLKSERCYIKINATEPSRSVSAPAPGRHRINMAISGSQVATGMENVQGDNVQCIKVLIDGELFILRGEKMYDATGKLVK
jgi:hypothetical protein